jgi:ABC-type Na+ efflux pump permease subunit
MFEPVLFRDRSRPAQIVLGGVFPAVLGALAGVLVGVSAGAYWAVGIVAAIGGFLSGFEHRDGWGGADRGLVGGFIYGVALLVAHAIAGTHAKVSLGSFPPLLAVVTAIVGMFLAAAGGRLARLRRERAAAAGATGADTDGADTDGAAADETVANGSAEHTAGPVPR